jgi:hypothetical protein
MASARPYTAREKAIGAADSGTIRQRWEYGRLLLVDDTATTPAGNLRNGVLQTLERGARKAGRKVSRREIQYRLQCARAYLAESQITHASAQFECWTDLRDAGFPPYEAEAGERPYDPRTTKELAAAHGRDILPEPSSEQGSLFARFDDDSTLAAMRRYAEEQQELTARFAARCEERTAYVHALIKAVDGDETKTWAEARTALAGPGGTPGP